MAERELISVPQTVRIKPGALARVGLYLQRQDLERVVLLVSEDLPSALRDTILAGCRDAGVQLAQDLEIRGATFEQAEILLAALPADTAAVVGLGGGRALDVAKYVGFLAQLPYFAVPTSLSNDGFCSPRASLTLRGERRSFAAHLPRAVIVDTEVCLQAPESLWWSGIGDLVAKITAVQDWKLAFHAIGTPVNDLAALLSDATVYQFVARPMRDLDGLRLLATALMLNGIAMEICGSSRPASGSEHLISHALDRISQRPRLHGLQVGVAAYVVSRLQGTETELLDRLFAATGFWTGIAVDPFEAKEWREAVRLAPSLRPGYYTVLSSRDCLPEIEEMIENDPRLKACFKTPGIVS